MQRTFFTLSLCLLMLPACAQINLKKIKEKVDQKSGTGTGLSNDEIIKGLKEALTVGSNNASGLASRVDGYYKNPVLFIPFPPEAKKAETKLRQLGYGKKADEFILTLNRAAENAAKESAPIFVDAIRQLTINDGLGILKGADTAATGYLRKKTNDALIAKFRPVIEKHLSQVNATKYWTELTTIYNKIPKVSKVNTDLAGYATERAIQGLFKLIADEEMKIRKDPAARVTDILKKVFAKQG